VDGGWVVEAYGSELWLLHEVLEHLSLNSVGTGKYGFQIRVQFDVTSVKEFWLEVSEVTFLRECSALDSEFLVQVV